MLKLFTLLVLIFFLCLSLSSQQLYNLQTADLNLIYYSNAHSYIIPHLARSYLRTWEYYQEFWNYKPSEESTVFIEDFSDWANGGASAVPRNFVYISMSPYLYVFEVAPANERMSLLMHHELTHITAMDMSSNTDRFWRKFFGSKIQQVAENPLSLLYAYLATPRKFAPRWYHEGIAVSMETWMSGGIGRSLGSYDEMVFRSMVRDTTYIYDLVGLEAEGTAIDFQVGANSYLYGARFYSYLGQKYGPLKLKEWVTRDDNSKAYFSKQFQHVLQRNLVDEWNDWISFEHDFQEQNLEKIRQNPVTEINPIMEEAMGSVSRSFYDAEKHLLYTAVKYPGEIAHILELNVDTGKKRKICNVKAAFTYYTTSLVWDQAENRLFFTTDNYYRRDLNVVDIETRKVTRLITDLRAGELALNKADRSLWGVRHENGISTIIRIESPYTDWKAVYAFPYGSDMYDLDISPDGNKLTGAITRIDGNQQLVWADLAKLQNGEADFQQIFDFDYSSPANFVFSSDGRYLFGTSYYSGVSNVYRYDFAIDDISIISNCETGFFRPVPVNEDSLIVFNYVGGKGWIPGWIENKALDKVGAIEYLGQRVIDKFPYVKDWNDGSPAKIDLESRQTYKGNYKLFNNIHLNGAYPIVEGYKNETAFGYHLVWQDAIGFTNFALNASYSPQKSLPEKERIHLKGKLRYKSFSFKADYNRADFYDLFGPTKVSRKGYSFGIAYKKNLIYDKPRELIFTCDLTGYGDLEILPDYQNVTAGYDEMYIASGLLEYSFLQKSLGAVDAEKGYQFSGEIASSYVNEDFYPNIISTADFGIPFLMHHCSIWLRNSAGYNFSDLQNSFANFYFGGFGNNWVDHQDEQRYRQYYSFPGLEINEVGGKSFAKSILELNLPPLRFRKFGIPALYARWLRPALFTSILSTNAADTAERNFYFNAGMQFDVRFITLSLLKSTLSFGYAAAWDEDWNRSEELMVSLKLF
ncbi:MAG: hypothetical protein K9N09_04750 [Candidatus Cloacimonetes bacterium]|nr:hypothetical protein [Candidatus Cloacimonadota bacterium]MCF7815063.1 hypothetical protein [Candidatus Cloacimonadota bacterium]MCF7867991.1 hypothetical protein [Candidatus Cloacimonadota bacterium]MCF7883449.1 hypothetical protein [Candidatus Cloacimonadota bacterium]